MINRLNAKDYLALSAIELFSKNRIEDVTVKDICQNCDLSTRTFYKYYRDKYDIINTCFESKLEEFFKDQTHAVNLHEFMLFTANIVCDRVPFFSNVFLYTGQNNIRLSLEEPIRNQYIRIIQDYYHDEIDESLYNAVTFFIKGQLSYVEAVIKRPKIPDAVTSVAYFENAIPVGLIKYLK